MSTSAKHNTCPATIERLTGIYRPMRTRMTHRIMVPAPNDQKAQLADSLLERDASVLSRFCARIKTYKAQPLELRFECAGKTIVSIPDVEVTYLDGSTELLEIKYLEQYLKPDVRQKCRRVKDQLAAMGMRYRVVTDKQIRRCPAKLQNFRRLLGYRLDTVELPDVSGLRADKEYLVADLAERFGSDNIVFHLIAKGKLVCDFSKPVTLQTRVRKAKPSDFNEFI